MAYRLSYSDYVTPAGPPNPDEWVGPPGPIGPPGPKGDKGDPGSLDGGGTFEGPLIFTATGGTAAWSDQDRWGSYLDARDFGVICDGVTDQGAALNAAIASTAPGTTMHIPASVYTTQTIVLDNGRKLAMTVNALVRPSVGSPLLECTCKIIGAPTLSPVVLVTGNEGGLDGVNITRNGTPPAGSIGLQVLAQNAVFTRVYSYNHARCIQVGALRAAPVNGRWNSITTYFYNCIVWRGTEDFVYLINAPETAFYGVRFGINGEADPAGANALVCMDGDLNSAVDAGTTNTVSFIRCQFNTAGDPSYSIRFHQYASPDGYILFQSCYSGGAQLAFLYVDPNCNDVHNVNIIGCTIAPMHVNQTLIVDAGQKLASLVIMGNHISPGSSIIPGLQLSGIDAQIIGNRFNGPNIVELTSMLHGQFTSNTTNTAKFLGAFGSAGNNFLVTGNSISSMVFTATGNIGLLEPQGPYGQQLIIGGTAKAGRVDFRRGSDGQALASVGVGGGPSGGAIAEFVNGSGNPVVRLHAANAGGIVQFMINTVDVGRVDPLGHTIARASGAATAPGAGFARLAFVNGTTAGTAKLVAYAGTSTTATTIVDNIGTGF